jgi:alpha-D-xyloside xylohydrolase
MSCRHILVAPPIDTGMTGRDVYLPPGEWIDYQTGKSYPAAGAESRRAGFRC